MQYPPEPGSAQSHRYPYQESWRPVEERVEDLLARMTLEEKIAQIGSYWITRVVRTDRLASPGDSNSGSANAGGSGPSDAAFRWLNLAAVDRLLAHGIGQISRPAGGTFLPARQVAELVNEIQRYLIEKTRLGIPALIHEECLSGFMAAGATTFPQAIGMASTWNPKLIQAIAQVIQQQMRSTGAHQGLSPLLDVARDPRWGRVEETFGEDPYLVATMARHYVQGLQAVPSREVAHVAGVDTTADSSGNGTMSGSGGGAAATAGGELGVVATLKHFAAHSFSEGGRNCAPVHVGPRELRDTFLWPFEAVVRTVHPGSLMNAYHDIDGVPCASDRMLLTDILRDEWGFDGYVVSDYGAVDMLRHFHHVAADKSEAAALALRAGVDVELPDLDCYGEPLQAALRRGLVDEVTIDEAVRRHLRYKFRLGLFEHPFVDPEQAAVALDTAAHRQLAAQVARESIVLLKNDPWKSQGPVLPLSADHLRTVAVIGPQADSARLLMGDYAFTAHRGLEQPATPAVTILDGIRRAVPAAQVLHAPGCDIRSADSTGLSAAVAIARRAEVAVVVIGEQSGLGPLDTSGEGRDQADLRLTGGQEQLVRAVAATGTPVVLILVNGRPLALGDLLDQVAAALEVWLPGEEGGTAVADVLFGRYNPAGRLPVSFPRTTGQIPIVYNRKPSSFRGYVFADAQPLFPFGHGLSYTRFAYSDLQIECHDVQGTRFGAAAGQASGTIDADSDGYVDIQLTVANVGERAGEEVVQLYVSDPVASVTRPVAELKGFVRLHLEAGERRTIRFRLFHDQLAFHDAHLRRVVEPGKYEVKVGASSQDIRLQGEFTLVGAVTPRPQLRHYFSEVEVG